LSDKIDDFAWISHDLVKRTKFKSTESSDVPRMYTIKTDIFALSPHFYSTTGLDYVLVNYFNRSSGLDFAE
jgi:hypothetical protein